MDNINFESFDAVVVGSGLTGATLARKLAEAGKRVLVLEKRNTAGGNVREGRTEENSVRVHLYGPHIFHTGSDRVYEFLSRFTKWTPYRHRVLASIKGKLVPVPFNFTSLKAFYCAESAARLIGKLNATGRERMFVTELTASPDPEIRALGDFVFENVFKHYTEKQWGIPIDKVDPSVINRVPVRLSYEDGYFADKYQAMPQEGFNVLIDNLLCHENIVVLFNRDFCDFAELKEELCLGGKKYEGAVVFTGEADRLCGYRFGRLPYRTTRLEFRTLEARLVQPAAVVNYPNEHAYTRVTEFKHLTGESSAYSTLLYEYPTPYVGDGKYPPFYPVVDTAGAALYARCAEFLSRYPNLILAGRLAEYKYYDMDKCVGRALTLADELIEKASIFKRRGR